MAVAAYDGRFNKIEDDLGTARGDIHMIRGDIHMIRGDIHQMRGDINLLKWMNGITWALCFGILFKLFLH